MKLTINLLFIILFAGCYTQQKGIKQADKFKARYQTAAAQWSADNYPIHERLVPGKTDTLITTDTLTTMDTLYVEKADTTNDNDSLNDDDAVIFHVDTVYITKKTTITKTDTLIQKSTDDLRACQGDNSKLIQAQTDYINQINRWKGLAKTRFWWIVALIASGLTYTFLKIKKWIP